ncbi:MAG TPA: hypothetical protein VK484_08685, partial [Ferruginibacter sp.]|nr:hypothetical protein [Ferruginibacter sp.]
MEILVTKNVSRQQVLCNWGWTLKQSSAVHIQALVSAEGILPGFCWLTSAFSYKFFSTLLLISSGIYIFS